MPKTYKVDTYKRHVYRLRAKPKLEVTALLELAELSPAAESEEAELESGFEAEEAELKGDGEHDSPDVDPAARPDEEPALGAGAAPDPGPELLPKSEEPIAAMLGGGAVAEPQVVLPEGDLEVELMVWDDAPASVTSIVEDDELTPPELFTDDQGGPALPVVPFEAEEAPIPLAGFEEEEAPIRLAGFEEEEAPATVEPLDEEAPAPPLVEGFEEEDVPTAVEGFEEEETVAPLQSFEEDEVPSRGESSS